MSSGRKTVEGLVVLFKASDDTADMIAKLLTEAGANQILMSCHFTDVKKGVVDCGAYLREHNPEVVIFDLSPPYDENWRFFETLRDDQLMTGRGMVLTTTNKQRLDEIVGKDSKAVEVVGSPENLQEIGAAIRVATWKAQAARLSE